MKALRNFYFLLIGALSTPFIFGCRPDANQGFTVVRSYSYTISASIGGNIFSGDGPTRFELKPKRLRRMKFRHLPEKPNTVMYAYRLTSKNEYNEKLREFEVVSGDTIEVAVTALQADNFFNLAKAVFESVSVSNVDTVYTEPKKITYWTDDANGLMSIESRYGSIKIDIGPLHSSDNRRAAPFLVLYKRFSYLFSKSKQVAASEMLRHHIPAQISSATLCN